MFSRGGFVKPGDFGPVGLAKLHLLEIGGLPDCPRVDGAIELSRKEIGTR